MDRRTAREEAFKLLFQQDFNVKNGQLLDKRNHYTATIVSGVSNKKQEIDQLISSHLHNWSYDRIALVEKTVLRIATYEFTYLDDIPVAVAINEAVELANKYGDEKSGKFVNGVLSKIIEPKEDK